MLKIYNTTRLERELIYLLLHDKITLMKVAPLVDTRWMTSVERCFVTEKIKQCFNDRRSVCTRDILDYEIKKNFDESLEATAIKKFEEELDEIEKCKPVVKVGIIIDKLKEADTADSIRKIIESSFSSLEKGDINDAIRSLKEGAININNVKDKFRVSGLHSDCDAWLEDIIRRKNYPELYAGIKTGFKKFDKQTGGLFGAELTLFFGLAGKGKSTVLKNVSSRIRMQGYNVLHVTNEENEFQVRTKYQSLESGIEYYKFKQGFVSDEEIDGWKGFNKAQKDNGAGDVFILEIPQSTDSTNIMAAWSELKNRGIKIDVIVIDYLDLMSSVAKAFSEWDMQGKVVNDLKQLAIDTNLPVITCTQAAIESQKMETKDNPFLTSADVYGSKAKTHTANTLIGIVNKSATANVNERSVLEQNRQKMILCVCKNRDGPLFSFRQVLEPEYGRLVEDDEIDDVADEMAANILLSAEGVSASDKYESDFEAMRNIAENVKNSMKNRTSKIMENLKAKENEKKD